MNFYSNAYCKIIGENYDIDYLSYDGLIFGDMNKNEPKSDNSYIYFIVISVSGFILLFIIILSINSCIVKMKKRNRDLANMVNAITFNQDDFDENDDDLLD